MNSRTTIHSRCDGLVVWLVRVLCLIPAAVFGQGISDVRIETPRDFGYTIGDRIGHEMHLTLNEPIRLDATTLPEAGRLNRWLEISAAKAEVDYRDRVAYYRISVDYQIFNAPPELTNVTIPQVEFLTVGGANPIPVFIPEWTFSIGPIANSQSRGDLSLQPDHRPQPIPVFVRQIRLATWAILLGGMLIYLAYLRFLLPRLRRNRFPFSMALAEMRRLQRLESDSKIYRLALQSFHTAVNATAGEVVFAGDLSAFLSANSRFAELTPDISAVYVRSQDVFFNSTEVAEPQISMQYLVDLCRQCCAIERSAA